MFVKQSMYPKLKGRAADIQGLDLAMRKCWVEFMDESSQQHVQIAALLHPNVDFGELPDSYSPKKCCQMAQLRLQLL